MRKHKTPPNTGLHYYDVAIAYATPWSKQHLTYSSEQEIVSGTIVSVPFGSKTVLGVAIGPATPDTTLVASIKPLSPTKESLTEKTLAFFNWMESYYPSGGSGHLHKFLPASIDTRHISDTLHDNRPTTYSLSIKPTQLQSEAYKKIHSSKSAVVLHGITGSGKTTVYAMRILDALKKNQHVLVLVPEISLIAQLASSIGKLLPTAPIVTYHSAQTQKENRRAWLVARRGVRPTIFIGTRSALFLPYSHLGVVIVDEAHEQSLKEDHENSHYHGLFAAASLAGIHTAQFVTGSATPPIPESSLMLDKGATLVCLHDIALLNHNHAKEFIVVDMNDQHQKSSVSSLLSKELQEKIALHISQKEQALLFINKLGTAHISECEDCGWHASCPKCDSAYVYHHDSHTYRCNICGHTARAATSCPQCSGKIILKSLAIKSIEQELKKIFPTARIARFDSTNKKSESITKQYEAVRNGDFDIIIGTQLMAKGFDFPLLSLVGVINADATLNLPDINADERLFNQLVQVSGRVARGHRSGTIIIQTRQPDNEIFQLIETSDWHSLFEKELKKRITNQYPPATFLAKITISGSTELLAKQRADEAFLSIPKNIVSSAPFPAFYHKKNRKYYWQILCRSKHRRDLLLLTTIRNKHIDVDFDPVTLI